MRTEWSSYAAPSSVTSGPVIYWVKSPPWPHFATTLLHTWHFSTTVTWKRHNDVLGKENFCSIERRWSVHLFCKTRKTCAQAKYFQKQNCYEHKKKGPFQLRFDIASSSVSHTSSVSQQNSRWMSSGSSMEQHWKRIIHRSRPFSKRARLTPS